MNYWCDKAGHWKQFKACLACGKCWSTSEAPKPKKGKTMTKEKDKQLAVLVTEEMATRVVGRPDFLELVGTVSQYEVESQKLNVTDGGSAKQAVDCSLGAKGVFKQLEGLRKEIVAFPNRFAKTVNDMFKGLKESTKISAKRVDDKLQVWKRKEEKVVIKQQAEIVKAAEIVPKDAESPAVTAEVPVMPGNAVQGASGVAYEREDAFVRVVNKVEVLKAALDSAVPEIPLDAISVDVFALKRLVQQGVLVVGEKHGLKVWKDKTMVTRGR